MEFRYPRVAHLFEDCICAASDMAWGKQVEFLPLEEDEMCPFDCNNCDVTVCLMGLTTDYIFRKYFKDL